MSQARTFTADYETVLAAITTAVHVMPDQKVSISVPSFWAALGDAGLSAGTGSAQANGTVVAEDERLASHLIEQRLYRTPYFVLPRLALQAMPARWLARLEQLLLEADETGLETPTYVVLRDEPEYSRTIPENENDPHGPKDRVDIIRPDPWADYRRGSAMELCPGFTPTGAAP